MNRLSTVDKMTHDCKSGGVMECPHCHHKISDKSIAHYMASKGGSKKKNFTPEEKERRRKLMEKINEMRRDRIALEKSVAYLKPRPNRRKPTAREK